jgi:hypothetical protein
MKVRAGRALAIAALVALFAGDASAQRAAAGGPPLDGQYAGTGVLLSGTRCAGTAGVPFPVSMTVANGRAHMPLIGGTRGLAGPVGAAGSLDRLAWEGDTGVAGRSSGRIADGRFVLDYTYDWPARSAVGCTYRYEGRRAR